MDRRLLRPPLLLLLAALAAPAPAAARELPPAELVDDAVAGVMEVTLSGAVRARKTLALRFAARMDDTIEIQAAAPQTLQGTWGWIQVVFPAAPGRWPTSTEMPDPARGIGYVDWAIPVIPDAAGICTIRWAEEPDGTIAGDLACPAQRAGKKRTFTLTATFVAQPTDAWRTCLPGWAPASPGPAASPLPAPSPGARPSPPPAASPLPPSATPAPDPAVVRADAGSLPACVPADPALAPPPPIDPCTLLTPAEIAEATGTAPGGWTGVAGPDGTCAYTDATGRGILVAAGAGRNPRPVGHVGGRPLCTTITLDLPGIGGTETWCGDPAGAWEIVVAGAATRAAGVRIVLDDPRIEGWRRASAVVDLLERAVARLPEG